MTITLELDVSDIQLGDISESGYEYERSIYFTYGTYDVLRINARSNTVMGLTPVKVSDNPLCNLELVDLDSYDKYMHNLDFLNNLGDVYANAMG